MSCEADLAALLSQPWGEGACRGYTILALERCGYRPTEISRVMAELHEVFDSPHPRRPRPIMNTAAISSETFCPKGGARKTGGICRPFSFPHREHITY